MNKIICYLVCIACSAYSGVLKAAPSPIVESPLVSAKVSKAVWFDESSIVKGYYDDEHKFHRETIKTDPHWVLLLEQVEGMPKEHFGEFNWRNVNKYPVAPFARLLNDDKNVYMIIYESKNMKFTVGETIEFKNVSYFFDEAGASFTYNGVAVKAVDNK